MPASRFLDPLYHSPRMWIAVTVRGRPPAAPQRTGWPGHREPSTSNIAKTHVGRARMARSLAWTMVSDCGGLVSVRAGKLGVFLITAVLRQRDRDGNFNVVVHAIPEVWSVGYC